MGLRGNLTTMSMPDLLQFLEVGRKTGLLKIGDQQIVKGIYFENGFITGAITNDPQEALGQFLLHRGKLKESQLKKALQRQRRTKERLGRVLIAEGLLEDSEVLEILRIRNLEAIYDLFLWEKAEFEFHDDLLYPDATLRIRLQPTPLIMEGVYRVDEWRRFRDLIPSDQTRIGIHPSCRLEDFVEKAEISGLFGILPRPLSMKEIGCQLHASPFHVYSQIFELVHQGLLQVLESSEVKEESPPCFPPAAEPVPSLLKIVITRVKAGKMEEAMDILRQSSRKEPDNSRVHELQRMVENQFVQQFFRDGLSPQSIPQKAVGSEQMRQQILDSQEGFILSRINDQWDIQSIVALSPFREAETLQLLTRLMKKGIIRFNHDPRSDRS